MNTGKYSKIRKERLPGAIHPYHPRGQLAETLQNFVDGRRADDVSAGGKKGGVGRRSLMQGIKVQKPGQRSLPKGFLGGPSRRTKGGSSPEPLQTGKDKKKR